MMRFFEKLENWAKGAQQDWKKAKRQGNGIRRFRRQLLGKPVKGYMAKGQQDDDA